MALAVATAPPLKSSGGLASRLEMPLERASLFIQQMGQAVLGFSSLPLDTSPLGRDPAPPKNSRRSRQCPSL